MPGYFEGLQLGPGVTGRAILTSLALKRCFRGREPPALAHDQNASAVLSFAPSSPRASEGVGLHVAAMVGHRVF